MKVVDWGVASSLVDGRYDRRDVGGDGAGRLNLRFHDFRGNCWMRRGGRLGMVGHVRGCSGRNEADCVLLVGGFC